MAAHGLLGGTFDPIHLGHLVLAQSAREVFGLEKVVFIPAGVPPHKVGSVAASAEDRYRMTALAVADNPAFEVSPCELASEGPSYTVDTVRALLAQPGRPEYSLIIGSDALEEIPTWHEYETLLSLIQVLAAARPGSPLAPPPALQPWQKRIKTFYPPALDISATMIRARVKAGQTIKYLVPDAVAAYIEARRLYSV